MENPASSLKQNFRRVGRPSNSRSNSMLSARSISRENGNPPSGAGGGIIHTIDEHANEFTSLLSRPLHNSAGDPWWEDRRSYVKWPATFLYRTYQTLASNPVNLLLVFVPLGIISGAVGWSSTATFILNFLAIIPLASLLSFATEELSIKLGQTLGGLLNASFGNAVELIVWKLENGTDCSCLRCIGQHCRPERRSNSHCAVEYARLNTLQHSSGLGMLLSFRWHLSQSAKLQWNRRLHNVLTYGCLDRLLDHSRHALCSHAQLSCHY